ncbi:hypothetical protein MLD38_028166 [Melastoma candidum]|uniref:Uncharacterized protein n=1 Tax=Melastoma candidum TaxID=119954 RepID=A0ACB9N1I5_9MYRT|nr:hypothetical protein MLD38_028166 [Melastoma candidum]
MSATLAAPATPCCHCPNPRKPPGSKHVATLGVGDANNPSSPAFPHQDPSFSAMSCPHGLFRGILMRNEEERGVGGDPFLLPSWNDRTARQCYSGRPSFLVGLIVRMSCLVLFRPMV